MYERIVSEQKGHNTFQTNYKSKLNQIIETPNKRWMRKELLGENRRKQIKPKNPETGNKKLREDYKDKDFK